MSVVGRKALSLPVRVSDADPIIVGALRELPIIRKINSPGRYQGRNGQDVGDPAYIAFEPNLKWFNLDTLPLPFNNDHFVFRGQAVPEPETINIAFVATLAFLCLRAARLG